VVAAEQLEKAIHTRAHAHRGERAAAPVPPASRRDWFCAGGDYRNGRPIPTTPPGPKGYLHAAFTRPGGKWLVFNRTFAEQRPWFVYAPSADTALFYDGDKEMNLLTVAVGFR
jgi:hypothetical protein